MRPYRLPCLAGWRLRRLTGSVREASVCLPSSSKTARKPQRTSAACCFGQGPTLVVTYDAPSTITTVEINSERLDCQRRHIYVEFEGFVHAAFFPLARWKCSAGCCRYSQSLYDEKGPCGRGAAYCRGQVSDRSVSISINPVLVVRRAMTRRHPVDSMAEAPDSLNFAEFVV
jgi:hypothetical protein